MTDNLQSLENRRDDVSSSSPETVAPILVLGLGNDLLRDDAIGLLAAGELGKRFADCPDIEAIQCGEMGLSLLDHMTGRRDVLIIDAVQTGTADPGTLMELSDEQLRALPEMSPHSFGVADAFATGRALRLPMPTRLKVYAVEVLDVRTIQPGLTLPLAAALPGIIDALEALVRSWR